MVAIQELQLQPSSSYLLYFGGRDEKKLFPKTTNHQFSCLNSLQEKTEICGSFEPGFVLGHVILCIY